MLSLQQSPPSNAVLVILSLLNFACNAAFCILAPFFPTVASERGVSHLLVGVIFSMLPASNMLVSPVVSYYISKVGRRRMLFWGVVTAGLATMSFVCVDHLIQPWFTIVAITIRITQGIGVAAISTAAYATAASTYPNTLGEVMGIMEACSGLGLIVGPVLGGLLYEVGGFTTPFLVLSGSFLCTFPLTVLLLPADNRIIISKSRLSMSKIIFIPGVALAAGCTVCAMFGIGFLEPNLSLHLTSFGFSSTAIGGCFVASTISYAIAAPFISKFVRCTSAPVVMCVGLTVSALSFLLLGPCPLFGYEQRQWLLVASLVVLGLGCGMIFVPGMPYMIQQASQKGNNELVNDLVAGTLSASFALGEIMGASFGGLMGDELEFSWASSLSALAVLSYLIVVLVIRFVTSILNSPKEVDGAYVRYQ